MKFEELLAQNIDDAVFSVLDVETTGLNAAFNNIIEIGIVKINKGKVMDRFSSLVNPARIIPPFITEFTGISNEDVFDAPLFEDIHSEILEFIKNSVITGHNLSFDLSFLRREFSNCGIEKFQPVTLCTLKLAKRVYPLLKSRSLQNLAYSLKIKNEAAHRALSDAETTGKILYKIIKKLKEDENFETVGELVNYQFTTNQKLNKKPISKKLNNQFAALPDAPGIYYFLNAKDEIIYIGKAKSLRDRIKSYLSSSSPKKTKKILKQAKKIKTELTNSELTALLAEAEVIKLINPRLNIQLKKYNNKYFLKITKTHKAPAAVITNHFDFDGDDYFGLFVNRKKAEQMKELVDKVFMLRECSDKEFKLKKSCFLAEIERCTSPCTKESDSDYYSELEKVYEFMYGKNQFALTRMINKMKFFSEQLKFEKAAEIKSVIDLILTQVHKTSLLAEPINSANVLIEISENNSNTDYLLMLEGKIFIKKYILKDCDDFDTALSDYFEGIRRIDSQPDEEDLEKMKIILNWTIRNRNKVKLYYLKEYSNKDELFKKISQHTAFASIEKETTFDIKDLIA